MPQSLELVADVLPGCLAATLQFPDDYEGRVIATLIKKQAAVPTNKAYAVRARFHRLFFPGPSSRGLHSAWF
ncbi:MAG: hypothetical protein U0559_16095 [Anaerolineae bacterium]